MPDMIREVFEIDAPIKHAEDGKPYLMTQSMRTLS